MEGPASPVFYELCAREAPCGHSSRSEGMFVGEKIMSKKTDLNETLFTHRPSKKDLEWHSCS